jgi:hypothetical protein
MTKDQYIAIAGILATLIGIIVTWLVAKISQSKKELSYRLKIEHLFQKKIADPNGDFIITYKGEELPEPALLSVDITNTGNVPIENPPIEIEAVGATYVIPGFFDKIPPGYDNLWTIDRTDAESCAIKLQHINPGQTARVRLLMDELPKDIPIFKCPMAGVRIKRQSRVELNKFASTILDITSPSISVLIKNLE